MTDPGLQLVTHRHIYFAGTLVPTTQQTATMNSLFGAYTAFTAFGAAIIVILAAGGAVQKVAEYTAKRLQEKSSALARVGKFVIIAFGILLICLVALGSGFGLVTSFLWLQYILTDNGWSWAYTWNVYLFPYEVGGLILITIIAILLSGVVIGYSRSETPNTNEILSKLDKTTNELSKATAAYTQALLEPPSGKRRSKAWHRKHPPHVP